jgi:phosphonoacetaldehyde hydrolase
MERPDMNLETIIFDLAGTLVDFGSQAPVKALKQLFADENIQITDAQAREPMGSEKREHIARILAMPPVQSQWQDRHGRPSDETDIDRLYEAFAPLQLATIRRSLDLIPGTEGVLQQLPRLDMQIAFNTGYSREMAEPVLSLLQDSGVVPASVVCGPEVPKARPAPHMALRNLIDSGASAVHRCVKVDDSESGIEEGRNAGMWTVGVAVSGNALGLSLAEWQALSDDERSDRRQRASERLRKAGAHHVIDSVADLLPCLERIEHAMTEGVRP